MTQPTFATRVLPGSFEPENHWYPKALNATIHPLVSFFMHLSKDRIIKRYCHLHPKVRAEVLEEVLTYQPSYFRWAGADLMHVTDEEGNRQMVVIENNSCPSGQKSMPLLDDNQELGGYRMLVERTIQPLFAKRPRSGGVLAVVYDKNPMEAIGYANAMAEVFGQEVFLATYHHDDPDPAIRFAENQLHIRDEAGAWHPIAGLFRYLTQKPWTRLPLHGKTRIANPIVACLAGGRNKMVASKAYNFYNSTLEGSGLEILTPETIWDVSKAEIPLWVQQMGGQAVIKNPYSNAGQGVWTIVNEMELEQFMARDYPYQRFIVQSLIGNYHWSSTTSRGKLYHVGTMPSEKGRTYVSDLRLMVSATGKGIRPLGIYARRALKPLQDSISEGTDSWDMLGTNLSGKAADGSWTSDTNRLLLMDRRDFNRLGIGLDDLIDAYIQTVLSMIAIDKMCINLYNTKGRFRMRLFKSLNDDDVLLREIMGS